MASQNGRLNLNTKMEPVFFFQIKITVIGITRLTNKADSRFNMRFMGRWVAS